MNVWDSWPKPWTRDQCRDRYVHGPEISISELAKISGVALGTLNRWCKGDSGKTWKTQRNEFQNHTRSTTDQYTIQNRSKAIDYEAVEMSNIFF